MARRDPAGDQLHAQAGMEVFILLFGTLFIASLLLVKYVRSPSSKDGEVTALKREIEELRVCAAKASDPNLAACFTQVQQAGKPTKDAKPPLLTLSEAGGFKFLSGKAEVSASFQQALINKLVPQLIAAAQLHHLDLIEVVGHTDEMPMSAHPSNLDTTLIPIINGRPSSEPSAASNAELGLARAVAVTRILLADPRIQAAKLRVIPLSAGQLVLPSGLLSPGTDLTDEARRRIEIRLRKLGE